MEYMMSKASEKLLHYTMPNDRKPDYFSYHKYSALNLLCKNEDIPSGLDQNLLSGSEICQFHGSESTFSDSIVEDLSNVKRERLQMLLKQSVACLNQEIDEIHHRIWAMFQIHEAFLENESSDSMDLEEPGSRGQNSIMHDKLYKLVDVSQSKTFRKAFEDLEVLMNVGLDGQKAIDNYFSVAFEELEVMEQNLEEYLNILASKCRQVTAAEREMLGQWIRSLPAKALGRVVEIIHCRHSSEKRLPDKIHVDLEKEDKATLWRLYFYIKNVASVNNI